MNEKLTGEEEGEEEVIGSKTKSGIHAERLCVWGGGRGGDGATKFVHDASLS
jgi:hypothetical protein